jgi:regulator of protease activity HflC (stomatin/prohibitin superfamily)
MPVASQVRLFTVCLAVFIFLVGFVTSWTEVPGGHVGVVRRFGAIQADPLPEGLAFILPFGIDKWEAVETRLKSYEIATRAATKDNQLCDTVVTVQHWLVADLTPQAYKAVGTIEMFDNTVVSPAVYESLKAVTALYSAEELIAKRDAVKNQVDEGIQKFIDQTLEEKGVPGAMKIANVSMKDFDFSDAFNQSIESKVSAQQNAYKARSDKEKRITEAEAAAREAELQADAAAYKIEKESLQRAEAIKREAEALAKNPNLIQLRAIEKWDGKLPTYSGGQEPLPFLNVDKVVAQ